MMIQRQSFIQKADVNARKEAGKTAGAAVATSGDPVSELITRGLGGKKNIVDVDCCATRLRITVAEPERVRDELLKQTDSRGIVKKGQGVQVIYGPHVTVIKAKLEEYLETAPNEFADETPDNVQVQENIAAENADGQNSAEVEDKKCRYSTDLGTCKRRKDQKNSNHLQPCRWNRSRSFYCTG